MADTNKHRRPVLNNRPWIRGTLWDRYSLSTILHCDAYLERADGMAVLRIDWREGGRALIARDLFLIEADGLTPLWNVDGWIFRKPERVYWTAANNAIVARIHLAVLERARDSLWSRYSRVSVQAHYVATSDADPFEGITNKYVDRKPYAPRTGKAPLHPDFRETRDAPSVGEQRKARGGPVDRTRAIQEVLARHAKPIGFKDIDL